MDSPYGLTTLPLPLLTSVAEQLGLPGLTIFPIPDTDTAAIVQRLADQYSDRLLVDPSTQDTLIFHGATAAHIDAIDKGLKKHPGRITFFGDEVGLLFFRMPYAIHDIAHLELMHYVGRSIDQMGLWDSCCSLGAAEYDGLGRCKKEGDGAIRPHPPRQCYNEFPTLVIEAGNSETLPSLYRDKNWWFDNSPFSPDNIRGNVNVVLLIKLYVKKREMLIERWYRNATSPAQSIKIQRNLRKELSFNCDDWQTHWTIEGGPLIIVFEDIFIRPKKGAEVDIVISEKELVKAAIKCWGCCP